MVIHQTILVALGEISLCAGYQNVILALAIIIGNGTNGSKKHSLAVLHYCINKLHYNAIEKPLLTQRGYTIGRRNILIEIIIKFKFFSMTHVFLYE